MFVLCKSYTMNDSFDILVEYVLDFAKNSLLKKIENNKQLRKDFDPVDLQQKLPLATSLQGISSQEMISIIEQVIDYSVVTNHPLFMNQMFGKTQDISFLADILIAMLNTSMYTYEVAPVFSLIEKEMIANLGKRVWGEGISDGVFTAGGSMSNMNALFLARQHHIEQVKQKGLFNEKPFSIFISEQAHYSFTKGVNFLGFGLDSLIKIKSNTDATINIDALKNAILNSKKEGRTPLMLIGIAGTTISGSYDDLERLAFIAKENNMWYHVDGAYGGSLLLSDREKDRLRGVENADSVGWNFHKIMGMSLSTSSFLTKEKGLLNKAFNVEAGYLFHKDTYDFDLGQKSLRGGRRPDAFKLWLSWKYNGDTGFSNHVEKLRDASLSMANLIKQNPNLELFNTPESTIVCFRYFAKNKSKNELDSLNKQIRDQIFKEGKIIFNYATLNDRVFLRCVLLDPDITQEHLHIIIDTVISVGEKLQ